MNSTLRFLCNFILIAGCTESPNVPENYPLTKENVRTILQTPQHTSDLPLKLKTYTGCESIPATDPIQKLWVGFEFTGKMCSVTVKPDNIVSVSYIEGDISIVPIPGSDIYIGEIGDTQVLIVQHDGIGKVVSVTQTVYDASGTVVYGIYGEGDYIKECALIDFNRYQNCE